MGISLAKEGGTGERNLCFCSRCKPYSGAGTSWCVFQQERAPTLTCASGQFLGFGIDVRQAKGMRWAAKAGLRLRQEAGTEERSLVQLEKKERAWADCRRRSQAAVLQQPHVGLNATSQIPFPGMFPSALQKYWDRDIAFYSSGRGWKCPAPCSPKWYMHPHSVCSSPVLTRMVYTSLQCLHGNPDSSHSQ